MSERAVFSPSIDEPACRRFEQAWFAGRPVAIEACLPDAADARYLPTLCELALIEMELAWKARREDAAGYGPSDSPPRVEDYLRRFPALQREPMLLGLVRQEYAQRRRCGPAPSLAEFAQRFPQLGLHDVAQLESSAPEGRPPPGEPTQSRSDAVTMAVTDASPNEAATRLREPSPPPASSFPERIGRYRILRILGEGGFGRVYLAEDLELERRVAIKTPHRRQFASSQDAEAYLAEARNVARLDHTGIVPVYDVGRADDGTCYVVSKYIEGCDLAAWRNARQPGLPLKLEVVAAVAEALHHAHRRGLVHRDIKPGNILLDADDRPHLVDFGLALRDEQYGQGPQFAGTPAYMSAEQARNEAHLVDARSDIFSLGVVLYELLTGQRPFRAKTLEELRQQLARGEVRPPRQIDDALPRELDRICLRALAKNPADRYSTARDLADELADVLAALTVHDSTAASRHGGESPSLRSGASAAATALRKLDFSAELSRWGENFVGREWLLAELEAWIAEGRDRICLALGDPGAGKSALLAQVIRRDPRVAAHHFCVASLAESLDPLRFVQSLAAQLAERLAGFRAALTQTEPETLESEDAGTLFRRILADPLRQQPGESPLVIVVDALDESLAHGERNIARLLYERLHDLPPRVRLLVSSRHTPEVCDLLARSRKLDLRAEQPENLDDVARYIAARLGDPRWAAQGAAPRDLDEAAIRRIADKSAGNFLYAAQILDAIAAGQVDPRQPETFPEGLVGIYHEFFARRFPTRQDFAACRPLLDVITAAREPLTADEIAEFLDRDPFEVEEALEPLASFFPQRACRYRPFHKSVTDWLCGAAGQSRAYRVDVRGGHRRIAEKLRRRLKTRGADALTLAHLPAHLMAAGSVDELYEVLTDIDFLEAKAAAGQVFELCRDVTDAAPHFSEDDPRRRTLDLLGESLCTDVHFLASYPETLFQNLWNRAWWYDCPQAERHYDDPPEGWNAPPPWRRPGPRLADLLETMRRCRRRPHAWLRAMRPPKVHLGTAQQAVYRGHAGEVWCMALSPDGRRLATGARDRTVRLWDADGGAMLQVLKDHTDAVADVAFSPDGQWLASAGCDGAVFLYHAETGERLARRDEPTEVRCLAFSPKGQLLAYGCEGGLVFFWRLDPAPTQPSESVESASGLRGENPARRHEATDKPWNAHRHATNCLTFSPDGARLATGGSDNRLCLWDVRTGRQLLDIRKAHRRAVHAAAFSPDGAKLLTCGRHGEVRLWDATTGLQLATWEGHDKEVYDVAFSPDGRRAATAGQDRTVRVWDLERHRAVACLRGHGHTVWGLAFSPDGEKIYSASGDRTVRVWNARRGGSLAVLRAHNDNVSAIAFSPAGRQIASASFGGELRWWDAQSGLEISARAAHGVKPVSRLAYSQDGVWLFSAGYDGTVAVWSPATGEEVARLVGHQRGINEMALSADGRRLLTASGDGTARLWETGAWRELAVLQGHGSAVWSVAFSPDGARLATAGRDRTVRLYDADTLEKYALLEQLEAGATALAFSPDGRVLATGHKDAAVRLWDATSGKPLLTLAGHREPVCRVVFSPDGRRLVSSEEEGLVREWVVASGECLDTIRVADADAVAAGPDVFPYRAVRRTGGAAGAIVEDSRTRRPLAWYPPRIWRLATHPQGHQWAGAAGRHLYLFCLEDA